MFVTNWSSLASKIFLVYNQLEIKLDIHSLTGGFYAEFIGTEKIEIVQPLKNFSSDLRSLPLNELKLALPWARLINFIANWKLFEVDEEDEPLSLKNPKILFAFDVDDVFLLLSSSALCCKISNNLSSLLLFSPDEDEDEDVRNFFNNANLLDEPVAFSVFVSSSSSLLLLLSMNFDSHLLKLWPNDGSSVVVVFIVVVSVVLWFPKRKRSWWCFSSGLSSNVVATQIVRTRQIETKRKVPPKDWCSCMFDDDDDERQADHRVRYRMNARRSMACSLLLSFAERIGRRKDFFDKIRSSWMEISAGSVSILFSVKRKKKSNVNNWRKIIIRVSFLSAVGSYSTRSRLKIIFIIGHFFGVFQLFLFTFSSFLKRGENRFDSPSSSSELTWAVSKSSLYFFGG